MQKRIKGSRALIKRAAGRKIPLFLLDLKSACFAKKGTWNFKSVLHSCCLTEDHFKALRITVQGVL